MAQLISPNIEVEECIHGDWSSYGTRHRQVSHKAIYHGYLESKLWVIDAVTTGNQTLV
jgi:hypothetical protein